MAAAPSKIAPSSSVRFEFPFTQTSHVVAFICALGIGAVISPFNVVLGHSSLTSSMMRLIHLASFSGWFGTQLWVTFFAGLTMFKHLPRHTFGFIQSKLFPKYFLLGTILSSVSMATFLIEHPLGQWGTKETIQGVILCGSLCTVLSNSLYIEPSTSSVMAEMHKIEKAAGAGAVPGKVEKDKLVELKKDSKYKALYGRFYRLHAAATIANLLSFCAQGVHLMYLASNFTSL